MDNKRCIVQFIHPGGEHVPDTDNWKEWNSTRNPHRRKFLVEQGRWRRHETTVDGPLAFWGEWEPPSRVTARLNTSPSATPWERYPRYLMEPHLQTHRVYRGLQNTDPCVFGGFFYTGCQQKQTNHLRWLDTGSVILFGSPLGRQFVLDTVFVVRDFIDHDVRSFSTRLADAVPRGYFETTLEPWYAGESTCSPAAATWRLYRGATHADPLAGMYSFVPAVPWTDQTRGFPRPRVVHPAVSPRKTQGYKLTDAPSMDAAAGMWADIREQVLGEGLSLGVDIRFPDSVGPPVET